MTTTTNKTIIIISSTMTTSSDNNSRGLILSNTQTIKSFFTSSAGDSNLSENLRQSSLSLSSQTSIPYQSLRSIWTSPKPREKSEELKARLRKLEELEETKAYADLVKDITRKKPVDELFSSYKDQLGFGLHVIVAMFTGYLVGYVAFRALFDRNPVLSTCGGILGLVLAIFVETLLFIIKTTDHDERSKASRPPSNLMIKKNQ